ncbi:MAG: Glycine reductase component B gamma subunit [Clostridiales bacterium 38_11]|nr:MAG: Glycine reductase component B gamma subunit [Clostridiales bacterium 38_11]
MAKFKVVHYINQFYAGIGGEEKADHMPEAIKGAVGPGLAFQAAFGEQAEIVATIVCGDSFYNENMEKARETILGMVKQCSPDLFVAGPAFNAGRYGVACGDIASSVQNSLGVKALSGMYLENPGVDLYKKSIYLIETKNSAVDMRNAIKKMVSLGLKLLKSEEILTPQEEGYLKRGFRKNYFADKRGSHRAIDMLIQKMKKDPFTTEFAMPTFDRVNPNPAIKDMSQTKIAIVTSGGIVPKGNPDHIESSSASKYGKYDISKFRDLTDQDHETAHGGYDPTFANLDSDRVIPVDVLRDMEKEGRIGELFNFFYATTGNGTSVANAKAFAAEIAKDLISNDVQAVILTST